MRKQGVETEIRKEKSPMKKIFLIMALSFLGFVMFPGVLFGQIKTAVEGNGYKNQIIRSNLLEAGANRYVIFTYGEANESGKPWKETLDLEYLPPAFVSSLSLQVVKEGHFSETTRAFLRKPGKTAKMLCKDNVYTYEPETDEIVIIRSTHGGEGKPNWVKLNQVKVAPIDPWPANNVHILCVKAGDKLEFESPGWKPAVFILDKSDSAARGFPLEGIATPASCGREDIIYLLEKEVGRVIFPIWSGQKKKPALVEPRLVFEYPKDALEFKVYEMAGKGDYRTPKYIFSDFDRQGIAFTRCELDLTSYLEDYYKYSVSAGQPMALSPVWGHEFLVLEPAGIAKGEFPLFWYFKAKDVACSPEKSLKVKILPALACAGRPKNFSLLCWGANEFQLSKDEDYLKKMAGLYKKVGILDVIGRINNGKRVQKEGLRVITHHGLIYGGFKGVLRDGKEDKVCFQQVIDNNYPMSEWLKRYNDPKDPIYKENFSGLEFDFEPKPADVFACCFCTRCRAVFQEQTGIDVSKMTPDEIAKKHKKEWIDFRVGQYEKILVLAYKATKDINSAWPFYLCSFYLLKDEDQNIALRNQTGQDMRRFVKHCDYLFVMIYKDPLFIYDQTQYNCARLTPNLVPAVHLNKGYFDCPDIQSPELVALEALFLASLKITKMGLYSGSHLDGGYFKTLDEVLTLIAQVEGYYFDGQDVSSEIKMASPEKQAEVVIAGKTIAVGEDPLAAIRIRAHCRKEGIWSSLYNRVFNPKKKKREVLVSIFNLKESKGPACVKIMAPMMSSGKYVIQNRCTGRFLSDNGRTVWTGEALNSDGITIAMQPMSARLLEIRPLSPGEKITGEEMASAGLKIEGGNNQNELATTLHSRGSEIKWTEIDGDGSLELEMITPAQKAIISLAGGRLRSWVPQGRTCDLLRVKAETDNDVKYGVGACYDMFFLPQPARWSGDEKETYEIIDRKIDENGNAKVTLKRTLCHGPLAGMLLKKYYTIQAEQAKIDVNIDVSEGSDPPQDMCFWVRNNMFRAVSGVSKQSHGTLIVPLLKGDASYEMTKDNTLFFLSPGVDKLIGFQEAVSGVFNGNWIVWQDPYSGDKVKFILEPDKVHQLYLCLPYTIEWMYKIKPMGFGNKFEAKYSIIFEKGK